MRSKRFTLEHIGAGILLSGLLISIFTQHNNYWLLLLFVIPGLVILGIDSNKKGKLTQFIWMNLVYLLIFAVLVFIALNKGV